MIFRYDRGFRTIYDLGSFSHRLPSRRKESCFSPDLLTSQCLFPRRLFPVALSGQLFPSQPDVQAQFLPFRISKLRQYVSRLLTTGLLIFPSWLHRMDAADGYCNHLCVDATKTRILLDCWTLHIFVVHGVSSALFLNQLRTVVALYNIYFQPPKTENIVQKRTKGWGDKCQQPGVTYELSKKSEQQAPPVHTKHGKHGPFGGGWCTQICFGSKAEPTQAFSTMHQLGSQWRYHGILMASHGVTMDRHGMAMEYRGIAMGNHGITMVFPLMNIALPRHNHECPWSSVALSRITVALPSVTTALIACS